MILLLNKWEAVQRLVISATSQGVTVARSVPNALDLLEMERGAYQVAVVEPVHYPAGIEVLGNRLPTIALTQDTSPQGVARMISQGARAVLGVGCTLQELKVTLEQVIAGAATLHGEQVQQALGVLRTRQREAEEAGLSPRQREVLALTARGLTAREIGETLGLSPRYVQNVRTAAYDKLGLEIIGQGRTQAATRWAVEHGIV